MGSPSPLQFYILPHICELYKRFSPFSEKSAFCIRRRLAERCFRAFCRWGVSIWSSARPAAAVPGGGRVCFAAYYLPPLACFPAPYPPNPRSQGALPRRGRGRPKVYFAGGFAPGTPALNRLRHLQNLPPLCPAGACLLCRLPTPPLASLSAPYPPDPLPRRGRGCPKVYFAGGFAPGTPALNRLRHLQNPPYRFPAQGSLRFGVKPTERRSLEQCRQPRRGGTGGEELRRLRWSSPPGQGEPVPSGFSPPPGGANAGRAGEAGASPPRAPQRQDKPVPRRALPIPQNRQIRFSGHSGNVHTMVTLLWYTTGCMILPSRRQTMPATLRR